MLDLDEWMVNKHIYTPGVKYKHTLTPVKTDLNTPWAVVSLDTSLGPLPRRYYIDFYMLDVLKDFRGN